MENLDLVIDLHKHNPRQGPGSRRDTQMAIELANLGDKRGLRIADIGCGTGTVSLQLARDLNAQVVAIDFIPEFLEILRQNAAEEGLSEMVNTLECSMENLPFEEEELDVIWSEGAIYNMGFEAGIQAWRRFLKPGGILAVSEITWFSAQRPIEIQNYWDANYSEMFTASQKIKSLEDAGYTPVGYFPLPPKSWTETYYRPLRTGFDAFLEKHHHSQAAKQIVSETIEEISMFEKYHACFGYGFYIARRLD